MHARLQYMKNSAPVFLVIRRSFSPVDFFAKKWNTARLIGNPFFIIMKKRGNTIEGTLMRHACEGASGLGYLR